MRKIIILILFFTQTGFSQTDTLPYIQVLGVAQDGGYPHFGCEKECCKIAWKDASKKRFVVSLALVDPKENKWWLLEATPDMKEQVEYFNELTHGKFNYLPNGILLTHAHIGHYAGLVNLGREVMNTNSIPVYVMPRMKLFLEKNGPWSQLVALKNIQLNQLKNDSLQKLSNSISIIPIIVPHRDEFSETVGFKIITASKKYLFIPDIDKWEKWEKALIDEIKRTDVAFLDATFNSIDELKNRKISEVPHPFVQETIKLLNKEPDSVKNKIYFIHFNHTNPILWNKTVRSEVENKKFNIAEQGKTY